jgi:hypothetical protein
VEVQVQCLLTSALDFRVKGTYVSKNSTEIYAYFYILQYVQKLIQKMVCLCVLGLTLPIPVAARSKAWVCGLWFGGIASSNPIGGSSVCLL